jgi:hypothetical protein
MHLRLAAILPCLAAALPSQQPENPPPWWGVADNVTVSLYWSFDTPFPAGQPTATPDFAVVPPWFNPSITRFTATNNVVHLPTFAGHTGVCALVGSGTPQTASLSLKVDNDPHLDWVKIFFFQFEMFEGSSGAIANQIAENLAQYGRATVTESSKPLAGGWQQVTIEAQLFPQPDYEDIDWTFLEGAFGTVAIDNLFVNSKCVKPGPDKDGDALGKVDGFAIDLTTATGGAECQGVAVTEGAAPAFVRSYWVSTRAVLPGASHQVFRLNQAGVAIGTTTLPDTITSAPLGASDLAVERLGAPPGPAQSIVYALVDRRTTPGGNVVLLAIDAGTGQLLPALHVTLVGFPPIPPQDFGLAFDPSGNTGAGTFWVTDLSGNAYEFARNGALLDQRPVPPGCAGLGYDPVLGMFYGFSRQPRPSPSGPVQVNGFEWSGYDFQPTGVEFCGDLTIPNGAGPRGGFAAGLEVYRRSGGATSQLRLAGIANVPAQNRQFLYELAGPYRFGWSRFGRCGMRGGPPFLGSTTFEVTLRGVPDALFAVMYLGFSNTNYLGTALPIPLATAGMPESFVSISPDVSSALLTPSAVGEFRLPVGIPTAATLGYTPVFFQWVVLDPNVPGFLGASPGGKTVLYP